jgi:dihydrofolate synthase/folylpolyglutamate synthase
MNFFEVQEYLFSLGNEVEAMKLGLDNIRKLLTALGNPENKYLKVQIAGTNGKGSVCAFLNSICLEAGIKTGLYTSPHLVSVTERVKINGDDISEEEFARIAAIVRSESEKLVADGALESVPTFFEQVTAIALLAFAEADVQLAILETGLGGRFDAVTAANAEICAITRIDYDHQKQLGTTIEEIASEKAAIIKEGSKVVIGEQNEKTRKVVLSRCREVGIEPQFAQDILAAKGRNTTGRECVSFSLQSDTHSLPLVFPSVCIGLLGKHQIENAKTAILLAEILKKKFPISNDRIFSGLENAQHPGRMEWIGNFLLDGAHNVGGAKALAAYLDEFVESPITLIFGAMRDKNVSEIAEILWLRARRVILTTPRNTRALSADQVLQLTPSNIGDVEILKTHSIEEALDLALKQSDANGVILVTGSLYLVGEARNFLTRDRK